MAQSRVLLAVTVVVALVLLGTALASSGTAQVSPDWVRLKDAAANRFAVVDGTGAIKVSVAGIRSQASRMSWLSPSRSHLVRISSPSRSRLGQAGGTFCG
jgi:hypothetical protein